MINADNLISLTKKLVKKKSITPNDDGAIGVVKAKLKKLGFVNYNLKFGSKKNKDEIANLFSIYRNEKTKKKNAKVLCFAGHTDVVPVGDVKDWKHYPFEGKIVGGKMFGRGTVDMKGAIAAWIIACENALKNKKLTISLATMITGDEEGVAINGTKKIVAWIKKKKIPLDYCLVGEPTNPNKIGEMIKIGRRGSLSVEVLVEGISGHVAYPHLAKNPLKAMSFIARDLCKLKLSKKEKNFPISNLEITSINTNNLATNVIPKCSALRMNIRYNSKYTAKEIILKIRKICKQHTDKFKITIISSNNPFYTEPDFFVETLGKTIKKTVGKDPILSTTGGTSDARFIRELCPVVEFGLVGKSMHKIDENVKISDLIKLSKIYSDFIIQYNEINS